MSEESPPQPEAQPGQPKKKSVAKAAKKTGKKSAAGKSGKEAADKQTRRRSRGRQDKSQADDPKVELDRKKVARRAWKIFLGEVNEEGLAMVADQDARELARRSLRIAEIYSQEEAVAAKRNKVKGSK